MVNVHTLILASASPARRATLTSAGIRHSVMVSDVDEDAVLAQASQKAREAGCAGLSAQQQVQLLAAAKACDVAERLRKVGDDDSAALRGEALVVGCDSMFELDGSVVGKPHTPDIARERLHRMSGRVGKLYTGHCVIDMSAEVSSCSGRGTASGVSVAAVHIAQMSDEEIEAYIASGEPLEVAGSFTIDGRGGPFVERIEGDHHGIVGISLPLLRALMRELGYSVTDFWQ